MLCSSEVFEGAAGAGDFRGVDCVEGVEVVTTDLDEMYWAIRSDSSRKFISSSYAPTIVPASGSQRQSVRRSTAEGVKHLLAMSP